MVTTTSYTRPEPQATASAQEAMTQMQILLPDAVEALRRNLTCGDPAVEVSAARVLIDHALMPEAAYSFIGHFTNKTEHTLTLKEKEAGGSWKTDPPQTVAPGGSAEWAGDYDGFDYTGKVVYKDENDKVVTMKWDIPLFGNNSIDQSTVIPDTIARHEGVRGWHAEVWYFLEQA